MPPTFLALVHFDGSRFVGWQRQREGRSIQAEFERVLERTERSAQIEEAISKLPTRYRELIVLRHVSELSYDEIAEVTGLPLGTVKNRIFRAREAMRKHLIRMGIEGVD